MTKLSMPIFGHCWYVLPSDKYPKPLQRAGQDGIPYIFFKDDPWGLRLVPLWGMTVRLSSFSPEKGKKPLTITRNSACCRGNIDSN